MTGVGNQTGTKAGAGAKPGAGFEAEVRGEATAYVGTGHHVVGVHVFWTHDSHQTMKMHITDLSYSVPDKSWDSPGLLGAPDSSGSFHTPTPYGNP